MFRDADFAVHQPLPANADDLVHDLDLQTLIEAMAQGDDLVRSVSKVALLDGLVSPDDITFRQQVLDDCVRNAQIVRDIYGLALNAVRDQHKMFWFISRNSPAGMMNQSPQVIAMYMEYLQRLRTLVDEHADKFSLRGLGDTLWSLEGGSQRWVLPAHRKAPQTTQIQRWHADQRRAQLREHRT